MWKVKDETDPNSEYGPLIKPIDATIIIEKNIREKNPVLDLGRCGLIKLPDFISDCADWLEVLILSDVWWDEKGELIGSQGGGTTNSIKELPESIKKLTKLKKLFLSKNPISDLRFLSDLPDLEVLDCDKTKITTLLPLSRLSKLKNLYCTSTGINSLKPISGLKQLESLYCSSTLVDNLVPISGLSNLKTLWCSSTKVSRLLPISKLDKLEYARFDFCKIVDCPSDVWQSGNAAAIRAFFSDQRVEILLTRQLAKATYLISEPKSTEKSDKYRQKDIKLILLGNSDAGKTTLATYLKTGEFLADRDSTHGLQVERWLPDEKRFPSLRNIAVSLWDFGGQEYYHETYRLFLAQNAVYVLLWDKDSDRNCSKDTVLKTGGEPEKLQHFSREYWLETIRHFSDGRSDAPLLVVQNKADDLLGDRRRIGSDECDRFGIDETYHISLKSGSEGDGREARELQNFVRELEHRLLETANKAANLTDWLTVRNALIDRQEGKKSDFFNEKIENEGWMRLDDFLKECEKAFGRPLSDDEKVAIPTWLNTCGTVVFFSKNKALRDKIFLSSDWLTKKIYAVLDRDVLAKAGEFRPEDLHFAKNETALGPILLAAMQQMELVFDHPTRAGFLLAPQYLPSEHAIEDLFKIAESGVRQAGIWLKMPLFYYKRALRGLILHYAKDPEAEARHFWKHGIVFLKGGLRALVKGLYPMENEEEGKILIAVERERGSEELIKNVFELAKNSPFFGSTVTIGESVYPIYFKSKDTLHLSKPIIPYSQSQLEVSINGGDFFRFSDLLAANQSGETKIKKGEKTELLSRFSAILPKKPNEAKRVFLSYSHKNAQWMERLQMHLGGLRRDQKIASWDDRLIRPGELFDEKIKAELEAADVFILLLSADFIGSEYIWGVEMKTAFEKMHERGAKVIPVLVEPMDIGGLPNVTEIEDENGVKSLSLNAFEMLPKTKDQYLKAVSLWPQPEEALAAVAQKIRESILLNP